MMKRVLAAATVSCLLSAQAIAQQKTVTGTVSHDDGTPLGGVAVAVRGTTVAITTNGGGEFMVRAELGQVLVFRRIGYAPRERTVGENFVNARQGRVAGVEVTSTSGVPGASSSITIHAVYSISSGAQPLMVIDGLPMDNKTLYTNVLVASDAPGSTTACNNRAVDFTPQPGGVSDISARLAGATTHTIARTGVSFPAGQIHTVSARGDITVTFTTATTRPVLDNTANQ